MDVGRTPAWYAVRDAMAIQFAQQVVDQIGDATDHGESLGLQLQRKVAAPGTL